MEAVSEAKGTGAVCRDATEWVLACVSAFIVPVVAIALLLSPLMWMMIIDPAVREARFEKVQVGMTMDQVRHAMGKPREVHTRAQLGSGIGEHAGPCCAQYEPPHQTEWVHMRAHVVWAYRQAGVVFDKDYRVLAKWGEICFD